MKTLKLLFLSLVLLSMVALSGCSDKGYITKSAIPGIGYKSTLAALGWGDGVAYVVGHKGPDVDAVTSALSYAELMRAAGYRCEARMAGKANNEMKYVSQHWNIPIPGIIEHVDSGQRLILTDHSEYSHAVDGADQARILQIIDHHGLGNVKESNTLVYKALPVGSTCTIVYESYMELGITPSEQASKTMLAGILSDTDYLTKNITTRMDSMVFDALVKQLKLSDDSLAVFYAGMKDAYHDYSGMTEEEIMLSDYKDYVVGDVAFGIGNIDWYDTSNIEPFLGRLLSVMPKVAQMKGRKMLFANVGYFVPNTDSATQKSQPKVPAGTYIVYYGDGAKAIAEKAWGTSLRDGMCFTSKRLTRKIDVVPVITEGLK